MSFSTATSALASIGFAMPANVAKTLSVGRAAADSGASRERAQEALRVAIEAGDVEAAQEAADRLAVASSPERRSVASDILNSTEASAARMFPAGKAWEFAAKHFDKLAGEFTANMELIDPDAEAPVLAADKVRQAYAAFPQQARDLDTAATALGAAAELASGVYIGHEKAHQIGLVCEGPDHLLGDLIQIWRANRGSGRGRRWADMVRLGVTLRAATAATFQPYGIEGEE